MNEQPSMRLIPKQSDARDAGNQACYDAANDAEEAMEAAYEQYQALLAAGHDRDEPLMQAQRDYLNGCVDRFEAETMEFYHRMKAALDEALAESERSDQE